MTLEELRGLKKDHHFLNALFQYIFDKESKQDFYYLLEGNLLLLEYYHKNKNEEELDKLVIKIQDTKINLENYTDLNYRYTSLLLEYYFLKKDITSIRKFISIKKALSLLSNEFLINYDLFRLYYLLKDYDKAFKAAKIIENEPLDLEEKVNILTYFHQYYLDNQKHDLALESLNKLKLLYHSQSDENLVFNIYLLEAKILMALKENDKALEILENNKVIKLNNIKTEPKIDYILLKLEILIEQSLFNKASILESENELLIEKNKYRIIDYYNLCILLYSKLNNRYSKEVFINKKETYRKKNTEEQVKEINLSENVVHVTLPELNTDYLKEKEIQEEVIEDKNLEFYNNLFFEYSLTLAGESNYREYFRNMNSYFESQFIKTEICLILNKSTYNYKNRQYDLHIMNYKNERVYDKIKLNDEIKDSLYFKYKDLKKSIYLRNLIEIFDLKCISSNKYYSDKEVVSILIIPFNFLTNKYGTLIFEFKKELSDEEIFLINKYSYLVCSNYYQTILLNEIMDKEQNKKICFEYSKALIKYETNNIMYFNAYSQEVLKIEPKVDFLGFLGKVSKVNLSSYKDKYYALKSGDITFFEEKLFINDKNYLEVNNLVVKNNKSYIISTYFDIDLSEKKKTVENELIYFDNTYKINNLYKLETDLKEMLEAKDGVIKFTLLMIHIHNLNDIINFLGIEFKKQVFKKFIEITSEILKNSEIYFYTDSSLIIKMNVNDARTIEKTIKEYISLVEKKIDCSYQAYNFRFSLGYLRFPMAFSSLKFERIYKYLNIALLKARHNCILDESTYAEFTKNDYLEVTKEEQIIKNVNEAFLNNKFDFKYSQIINYQKKTIYGYYPHLLINNMAVNMDFIYDVFSKRNLIYNIDVYVLKNIFKNIKETLKEFKKFIKVFIKINIHTLMNDNFHVFLKNLSKEYPLYEGIIHFIIVSNENKYNKKEMNILDKLSDYKIKYYVSDLNLIFLSGCSGLIIDDKNFYEVTTKNENFSKFLKSANLEVIIDKLADEDLEKCLKLEYNYCIEKNNHKYFTFEELKVKLRK